MSTAVLIVNFKAYAELGGALDSVIPALRSDDEVVVVDHASDGERIRWIAETHPRATIIASDDNPGFAAGINRAAKASRAPFMLFLNPDARIEESALRVLEQWLCDHPECGAVGPRILNADGTLQPSARRFPGLSTVFGGRSTWLTRHFPHNWFSERNLVARDATTPQNVDWIAGACIMTRRDVFERLGGLDDAFFLYWEDADYCRRLRDAGLRCTYLPQVSARHAGGVSARYDLPRSIRSFHASAFHLFHKYSGPVGRLVSPLARAGLFLRGELRVWQAKRIRDRVSDSQ